MPYRRALTAFLFIATCALFAGCGGSSSGTSPVLLTNISATQLETMLAGPQPPVVLDVRTTAEYDAGHIPGSVNIPLSELAARVGELNPSDPVVCVCASGMRSVPAGQALLNAGFRSVYNLEDGLGTWHGIWVP